MTWPLITDLDVVSVRPARNLLDPWRPYAFLVEQERTARGAIEDVATIFLTNRECPFRCTMCDLWKNTLIETVPAGAILAQIDFARERLPQVNHVKLYNAGNFFDAQAIPPEEHAGITARFRELETLIVENHPRLTDDRCLRFRDQFNGQLEIAMGLETIHPEILASLNKRMTIADFDEATRFLTKHEIRVRSFLLLNPPGLNREEGIDWAFRSLVHAIDVGVTCISLIPTRAGNGLMDQLKSSNIFFPPSIHSMEQTLEQSLEYIQKNNLPVRVFMDLWDASQFFDCADCGLPRSVRIQKMNLSQKIEPPVNCNVCRTIT